MKDKEKIKTLQARVTELEKLKSRHKTMEAELQKKSHDLAERLKELNCLYTLSKFALQSDISLEEIFNGTVDLIPPSWQYPDITCARIIFQRKEFKTDDFKITKWKQTAQIKLFGEKVGAIELYYKKKSPKEDEGPFLKEERDLIDAIAKLLGEIAAHKRTKQSKDESDIKYRSLYESSRDGIGYSDVHGNLLGGNPALLNMLGYSIEELRTLTYQQITPRRWHQMEADIVKKQIMVSGYSDEYEKEYIKKDGTIFPVSIRAWLINDRQSKPEGQWGIVRDITARKKREAALKESEILLQQKSMVIEKKNIALKEIIDQVELEKKQVGERVIANINKLVLPILKKLNEKVYSFERRYVYNFGHAFESRVDIFFKQANGEHFEREKRH